MVLFFSLHIVGDRDQCSIFQGHACSNQRLWNVSPHNVKSYIQHIDNLWENIAYVHIVFYIQQDLQNVNFIDPRGRPTVTVGSDHCFCTRRPSVRPHFSKQNKFQVKTMFATGETVGLAEWIIDDTFLVYFYIFPTIEENIMKNLKLLTI